MGCNKVTSAYILWPQFRASKGMREGCEVSIICNGIQENDRK